MLSKPWFAAVLIAENSEADPETDTSTQVCRMNSNVSIERGNPHL